MIDNICQNSSHPKTCCLVRIDHILLSRLYNKDLSKATDTAITYFMAHVASSFQNFSIHPHLLLFQIKQIWNNLAIQSLQKALKPNLSILRIPFSPCQNYFYRQRASQSIYDIKISQHILLYKFLNDMICFHFYLFYRTQTRYSMYWTHAWGTLNCSDESLKYLSFFCNSKVNILHCSFFEKLTKVQIGMVIMKLCQSYQVPLLYWVTKSLAIDKSLYWNQNGTFRMYILND